MHCSLGATSLMSRLGKYRNPLVAVFLGWLLLHELIGRAHCAAFEHTGLRFTAFDPHDEVRAAERAVSTHPFFLGTRFQPARAALRRELPPDRRRLRPRRAAKPPAALPSRGATPRSQPFSPASSQKHRLGACQRYRYAPDETPSRRFTSQPARKTPP